MSKAKLVKVDNQQELEKVLEIIGNPLNTKIIGDEYQKKYDNYIVVGSETEIYKIGWIIYHQVMGEDNFIKDFDVITYKEFIPQNNIKVDNPQESKPKTKKSKYKKAFKKLQKEYDEILTINKKLGSKLKCHKEYIEALSNEIERLKCAANEIHAHLSNLKYPDGRYILNDDNLHRIKEICLEMLEVKAPKIEDSTIPPLEKLIKMFSENSFFGELLPYPTQREPRVIKEGKQPKNPSTSTIEEIEEKPIKFDYSKIMEKHHKIFNKFKIDNNMKSWVASHDTLANTVEVTFIKEL